MQLLSSIAQNVKVWFEKHALEIFYCGSVLFDNGFKLNSDLKSIIEMNRPRLSPELHAKLFICQASHAVWSVKF